MPFLAPNDQDTAQRSTIGTTPPAEAPDYAAAFGAAFRQSDSLISVLTSLRNSGPFQPVDGYNPIDDIRDSTYFDNHASRFFASRSPAETDAIKRQIDGEEADKRTLAGAGAIGVLAQAIAGILDPVNLLPGRIAIGAAKEGVGLVRGALEVGGAMAASTAAQEGILQATQETRPLSESVLNVGSATLLGALLGSAASVLSPAERQALAAALDRDRAELDAHVTGQPMPTGAAAADTRTLNLVPTGVGLEKIPENPVIRSLQQPSIPGRRAVADLAEVPYLVEENRTGGTTTSGGAPLEALYRVQDLASQKSIRDELLRLWGDLRFSGERIPFTDRMRIALGLSEREGPAGAPTFEQFKQLVTDAYAAGDQHPIPQVQAAAQFVRRHTEAWVNRAEASIDGFERSTPREGEGHLPHSWNKPLIEARRPQFVDELVNNVLAPDQAAKRQAQDRLRAFQGALESHETNIKKLTEKLERRQAALEEDEALRDEVSKFNKFAFQRATALRQSEFKNVGGVAVPAPGKNIEKARGGAVFETKARGRINELADRASAHMAEVEELENKLQAEHLSANAMRERIEKEIEAWEGGSSKEAKAALKAREQYEAERTAKAAAAGKEKPTERLRSADDAVDRAVKRILASDRDKDIETLRSYAHEIVDRILGSPDGRIPFEDHMGAPQYGPRPPMASELRGSLAARRLDVSNEFALPWVERDIEKIVQNFNRTFMPDVLLAERFGDIAMTNQLREVMQDYARLIDATKSEREATRLGQLRDRTIADMAALRDRFRGLYNVPTTASMRQIGRISAAVRNAMVPLNLGMAAVSSIPDAAGTVLQWGMASSFRDAWLPFLRSLMTGGKLAKEVKREARVIGLAIDTFTASRHHELAGIADGYHPHSPLERTLQWGADKFQLVNGLAYWTDLVKSISFMVSSVNLYRAAKAAEEGTATAKQITELGAANISPSLYGKIAEQYEKHGTTVDGVMLPNTAAWTREARDAFEAALSRAANINVVTPGLDKPLFMSDPIASVLLQFKSFTAAAHGRILIANLQRADAQTLQGLVASLALGAVSYKMNVIAGGQATSERPQDWLKEAAARGSIFGWLEEGNALASKMTRGGIDIYRLIGADKPLSKFASRTVADQLLGPTFGKMMDLTKVTGSAAGRDWTASDTKALRRMIATQNLAYLRRLFDEVEAGANNAFGIRQ